MFIIKKYFAIYTLIIIGSISSQNLVDESFAQNHFIAGITWADSHAAKDSYLGTGLLYYTITYILKAKVCVCLGSGAGFVPQLMRQAQKDLKIENARTILIDANIGDFGRPEWASNPDHKFLKNFPDVEIIKNQTDTAAKEWLPSCKINYLHIDADHSFGGCLLDFKLYLPLMSPNSIITIHDTGRYTDVDSGPGMVIKELQKHGYELVNFDYLGAGVAIVHINQKINL